MFAGIVYGGLLFSRTVYLQWR